MNASDIVRGAFERLQPKNEENQQGVNHETPDQFQQTLHRARR